MTPSLHHKASAAELSTLPAQGNRIREGEAPAEPDVARKPGSAGASPSRFGQVRSPWRAVHRAFTLIELLVVMGIILLLIALLLPAVERAYRDSVRTAMAADLQVISQALETYRTQFGDYPRSGSSPAISGPKLMAWALIAPGPATGAANTYDGADGPGFRIRGTQGTVYGPYLPADRFPLGTLSGNSVAAVPVGTPYNDSNVMIGDRYNHVILYIPASRSVSPSIGFTSKFTVGGTPTAYYNYNDIGGYVIGGQLTAAVFAYRLGQASVQFGSPPSTPAPAPSLPIGVGDIPILAPYILWSAGPDGVFGPQIDSTSGVTTGQDDDVTYPQLNPVPANVVP